MRRGAALAGMVAVFAAMLGRAGLVDWLPIIEGVVLVVAGCGFVVGVLILAVGLPGLALWLAWSVIKGVVGRDPAPPYSALSRKN